MRVFFHKKGDHNLGSNRIYIDNLSFWLSKYVNQIKVSDKIEDNYDIYILSKFSSVNDIRLIKNNNIKSAVGIIHPNDTSFEGRKKLLESDFCLTGSIEERDYYFAYNDNIFRFPQIERISIKRKKHIQKEKILIGYHGNLEHLEEIGKNLKLALEKLSKEIQLEMIVVYDKELGEWRKNRPNIKISFHNWTMGNMINLMKEVDIGIVPCVNDNFFDKHYKDSNIVVNLFKRFSSTSSRINDYLFQYKVTSNAGRSFVFHQLGIPVIADFWPCHFEMLSSLQNGRLAHSENSWYLSLKELSLSHTLRQQLSDNSFKEFNEKYNYNKFTNNFYKFILEVYKKKI